MSNEAYLDEVIRWLSSPSVYVYFTLVSGSIINLIDNKKITYTILVYGTRWAFSTTVRPFRDKLATKSEDVGKAEVNED